jgi:hypothetical protein
VNAALPSALTRRRVRLVRDTKGATCTVAAGSEGWAVPVYAGAALSIVQFDGGARLVLGPELLEVLA